MITSVNNGQVKNTAALIKKAKERRAQGAFVVEGAKMCFEAPTDWVRAIYVSESFLTDESRKRQLENYLAGDERLREVCEVTSDAAFKAMSDTQTPQGILSVVNTPEYRLSDLFRGEKTLLLVLESIQDPGNLGTMMRTGEGAGISGIIVNDKTADLFAPKTVRSTMGSIYRIPYFVSPDLAETIAEIKEAGVKLYAAHLKGTKMYDEPDYTGACAFLIGNEGNGLSDDIADLADCYIRIPMEGAVESLNAGVSASLLMYECNRQRRKSIENMV